MAAGSFVVIKQGDSYRLLYSGKNFGTGLTVQAIPYNPSGTAGSAISFTELGTTGIYYADWSSAAVALGTWTFIIDATDPGKSAKSYTRVQVVDGDTLDDTMFEKIDTMLDSIITALTTIDGKVDIIDGNVDDIEGEVKSATYGLSAIKTVVDAINSAVGGIQNNTQTTVALPEVLVVPETGTSTYKIYVNTYNSSGSMEDPDDQDVTNGAWVSVKAENAGGTDRSANLGGLTASVFGGKKWMTRVSQGRFSCTYAVADTHAIEQLVFTFDYLEQTNYRIIDRATRTAGSTDDYTSRFDTIDSNLAIVDGNVDDIETIVSSLSYGNAALKTLIDAIQADLDDGTDGLTAIKTAITSNYNLLTNATYGLSALKTIIDTINSNTTGVSADLTDIKGTGFATGTDSLKAISDRLYTGGIAI